MPDIEVMIGGRGFMVSCQPGEEHFLRSAAAQLDVEAQPLVASMGRLPETKMLLMAGLMLADRTAAQEEEMRELRAKLSMLEDRPEPEARRIEVPVIPPQVPLTFAELAARAEALAERIGEKATELQRSAGTGAGQSVQKKVPAKAGAVLLADDARAKAIRSVPGARVPTWRLCRTMTRKATFRKTLPSRKPIRMSLRPATCQGRQMTPPMARPGGRKNEKRICRSCGCFCHDPHCRYGSGRGAGQQFPDHPLPL